MSLNLGTAGCMQVLQKSKLKRICLKEERIKRFTFRAGRNNCRLLQMMQRDFKIILEGQIDIPFCRTSNISFLLPFPYPTQVCPALWARSVHVFSIHNSPGCSAAYEFCQEIMELVKAVDLVLAFTL